ncbi:DUF3140 domain-containing protein [Spongiactinospora sp. TRM90649]|uniref:DUF3140 domain-containing protein n=1 Tax=Spongiactinospora sp. TRM90649 TaxID=3031114 RepID=UPI0023F8FE97|nr:DUF3140 domain-containing protein [Spongiactinospora sp. TRM90649]MDF5752897.1 DUF3140 domain-containing protein [Spongiactinospora sp. TRM90649]
MADRNDPELERLWRDFHGIVNMTSEELRAWLLTDAAGEEAFEPGPDLGIEGLGRGVLHVLGKRKVDLTGNDLVVMRRTIDHVADLLAGAPPDAVSDDTWRHALMSVGHDPLRSS